MNQTCLSTDKRTVNRILFVLVLAGLISCGMTLIRAEEADIPGSTPDVQTEPVAEPFAEIQIPPEIAPDIPRAPTPIPVDQRRYMYTGEGTRDPFVPLTIHRIVEPGKSGLAAMNIAEITILGVQIGLGTVAMVRGIDGKAYNMEVGQSLLDGRVVAIEPGKVTFERVILDSLAREVDKETIEYYLHR